MTAKDKFEMVEKKLKNDAFCDDSISFIPLINENGTINIELLRIICARLNSEGGLIVACKDYSENRCVGYAGEGMNDIIGHISSAIEKLILPKISENVKIVPMDVEGKVYVVIDVPMGTDVPYAVLEEKSIPAYGFYEMRNELVRPMNYMGLSSLIYKQPLAAAMEHFISHRCSSILRGHAHTPLISSAKIVVHYLPANPFDGTSNVTIDPSPFEGHEWGEETLATIMGTLYYFSDNSYIQVYGNGIVEAVDTLKLRPLKSGKKRLSIIDYQNDLSDLLRCATDYYGTNNGTVYSSVSIVDAVGYEMKLKVPHRVHIINKNIIRLPIIPLSLEGEMDKEKVLSQVNKHIEMLWNTSGF